MIISHDILLNAKAWPFEEARKIIKRIEKNPNILDKGYILLETGYGPSGLPHIGTFGEVLRTSMVMNALRRLLPDIKTKLFAFSDDMDGFRKVPTNVPNQELLYKNLDKPLTKVPDPFEKYESFAHHNNKKLCEFLDSFGFEYEFKSSTSLYTSGFFNDALFKILEHYKEIMNIMIPSLREERQKTYSPFLPICKKTGKVLQVATEEVILENKSIVYRDPFDNELVEISVLDGNCKLQWKVDWGMRWYALGVDYEMSGKDLIDSVKLSSMICREIGGNPPEGISYELFLDEEAKKISKSKGNGLSIDDWLKYAPQESLSYYMYQSPKRAKRLYFDVIPSAMDDYIESVIRYPNQTDDKKVENTVFHIHNGNVPNYENCLKFSMLLNLVEACSASDESILIAFIKRYAEKYHYNDETFEFLRRMTKYAIVYYEDFISKNRKLRIPDESERVAFEELLKELSILKDREDVSSDDIQSVVFAVGKKFYIEDLRGWFILLYQVLFGSENGPKMGTFISLYGIENTISLIKKRLNNDGE